MNNVIIISTEHLESGKCNSEELINIFESIEPSVIFIEEPNDDKYHSYFSAENTFRPLEIQTVINYSREHVITHVPVDKPINEYASLFLLDQFTKMFKQYPEYRNLISEHCLSRDREGFTYLNSKKCSELNFKKLMIERQIISSIGQNKNELLNLYNQFHKEVDDREKAMIENICTFAKDNSFNNSVFPLGYAHRESLRKKVIDDERVNWIFLNE